MAQFNNAISEEELVGVDEFFTGTNQSAAQPPTEDELVGIDELIGDAEVTEQYVPLRTALGLDSELEQEMAAEAEMQEPMLRPAVEGPREERAPGAEERVQRDLQRKLEATAGFFESGRDQEELTSIEMQQRVEEGREMMLSDTKFVGENLAKGAAAIADMYDWATYSSYNEAIDRQLAAARGEEYNGRYSFTQATEDAIKAFYTAIGEPPVLQKPETALGVTAQFGLQNFGAAGPIALIRQGLKNLGLKGAVITQTHGMGPFRQPFAEAQEAAEIGARFFDDFLVTEAKLSALGGVGAGAFWSYGSTEEQKEQLAHLGNLVFSLAPTAAQVLPSAITMRQISRVRREMSNPSEFWGKHDKQILANLSKLVPEIDIPKIEARIKEIRQIQQMVPEFQPSVGNIIGTNNARQIQSIIDTDNFDEALAMYTQNKNAVEALVRKATEEADPAQREVVAHALRYLRDESILHADRLRDEISRIQDEILQTSKRGMDPDAVGAELRESLKTARQAYDEHMKSIFDAVDPEGTARFDIENLKTLVSGITAKSGLGDEVSSDMAGYKFLTQELPAWLNKQRGKGAGEESLRSQLGMQVEGQTISYQEMYNMRKALGREATRIRNGNSGSRVPDKLDAIKAELDRMVNEKMKAGDKAVAERHFKAIEAYREDFIPRFGKGAVSNILRMDGREIPNDQIASTLWKTAKDDEVTNLKQIRDIFEESGLNIKDPALFAAAKDMVYGRIEDFAIRDLNKVLTAAADEGKDMLQTFTRWSRNNATKMDAFPTVRAHIDEIGQELSLKNAGIEASLNKIEDLTANVINKYSKIDSVDLTRQLAGATPLEVRTTFRDLLVRNELLDDFDPEIADLRNLDEMIDSIADPTKKAQALALRDAISESTIQFLFRRSMKSDGSGFDPDVLISATKGQDDYVRSVSLDLLLNPAGKESLQRMRHASQLIGSELNPQAKIELDATTAFLKKFGVSAPSISARLYAHQLGKVGPVYIVADTLMRTLRGVNQVRAKSIYKETMYNLDGLEKLIEVRKAAGQGDADAMKNLQELGGAVKQVLNSVKRFATDPEVYKQKLKEAINGHTLLQGLRLDKFLDSVEDNDQKSNLDSNNTNPLEFYLQVHDDQTGQPSRINSGATLEALVPDDGGPSLPPVEGTTETEIIPLTTEEIESLPTQEPTQKEPDMRDAAKDVYNNLRSEEGAFGDTTGAAVTGELGVTSGARDAVKGSENMSDSEVADAYIRKLDSFIPEEVPYEVRYSLIDTAYNAGEGIFQYPKLSKAIEKGDWMGVATNLLDTASIGGESSKGIAGRRARAYNRIAEANGGDLIESVFQAEDGTISYLGEDDEVIFSYKPKGGRHESSAVGMLRVEPTEMVAGLDTSNGV